MCTPVFLKLFSGNVAMIAMLLLYGLHLWQIELHFVSHFPCIHKAFSKPSFISFMNTILPLRVWTCVPTLPFTPNIDQIEWCWSETLEAHETITRYWKRVKRCSSLFIWDPWSLPWAIDKIAAYDFWALYQSPVQRVLKVCSGRVRRSTKALNAISMAAAQG